MHWLVRIKVCVVIRRQAPHIQNYNIPYALMNFERSSSHSNVDIIQWLQFKTIGIHWYVSNRTLHDSNIPYVCDVIKRRGTNHYLRLLGHLNDNQPHAGFNALGPHNVFVSYQPLQLQSSQEYLVKWRHWDTQTVQCRHWEKLVAYMAYGLQRFIESKLWLNFHAFSEDQRGIAAGQPAPSHHLWTPTQS